MVKNANLLIPKEIYISLGIIFAYFMIIRLTYLDGCFIITAHDNYVIYKQKKVYLCNYYV